MRNPSLHIRLTDFIPILEGLGIDRPKRTAVAIFQAAVPFHIKDRYTVTGDAKTRNKLTKALTVAKTSDMTVQRFNRILDAERRAAGHRHLTPIRPQTAMYEQLKEIAYMAVDFCHGVGIENIDEGCKMYIRLGLEKMKRGNQYALNKFKYYDEKIYQLYESYDMLNSDPDKELTKQFSEAYINCLAEYAAITRDVSKPEDYVCFLYAKLEAQTVQAEPDEWIRAQFEELGRAFDSIPNPNQLFSEHAMKRYYSYIGKPQKEAEEAIIFHKPKSDFEEKYQRKLREKYSE